MSMLPRNSPLLLPRTNWQAGNLTGSFFSLVKAVLCLQTSSWGPVVLDAAGIPPPPRCPCAVGMAQEKVPKPTKPTKPPAPSQAVSSWKSPENKKSPPCQRPESTSELVPGYILAWQHISSHPIPIWNTLMSVELRRLLMRQAADEVSAD